MYTMHFLGKVLPEIVSVSLESVPVIKWEDPDIGLVMSFTISIANSQIDVECKLNRYQPADLVHVYMRALDLSRASVDLVAFSRGWGLAVTLETLVDPSGATSSLLAKDDSLAPLCTAFDLTNGFADVLNIILAEPAIFMVLNDLITAITLPHVSVVNCARAIEGLRHLIASPGSSDTQAWEQMRQALQIDRAYLTFITRHSTAPRHGNRAHISGAITTEVTRRSWIIMNRYFEYRRRGAKPLTTVDFPLLSEPNP